MRQKLVYSQGILQGMALEKYDLVSRNALHMRNMSKSNFWLFHQRGQLHVPRQIFKRASMCSRLLPLISNWMP